MSEAVDTAKDFDETRKTFFALVGQCITMYQQVEDYLLEVFDAALGGEPARATAIFDTVRGLDGRLRVVSAALTGQEERLLRWRDLANRVTAAAAARNQIAHARPRHNAGGKGVILSGTQEAPGEVLQVLELWPARMELVKGTAANEVVWTEAMLRDAHASAVKLFGHLLALSMELRGQTPPKHLLEA